MSDGLAPNDASIYGALTDGAFYVASPEYLDCDADGVCGEAGECSADAPIARICNGQSAGTRDLVFASGARPLWKPSNGPDGRGCADFDGVDDVGVATGFSYDESAGTDNPSLQVIWKWDDVTDEIAVAGGLGRSNDATFMYAAHIRTATTDLYRYSGTFENSVHNRDFGTPEANAVTETTVFRLHEIHAYEAGWLGYQDGDAVGAAGGSGGINTSTSGVLDRLRIGSNGVGSGQFADGCFVEAVVSEGRTSTEAEAYRDLRVCPRYPSIDMDECPNLPPSANAGMDDSGAENEAVAIDCSASTDDGLPGGPLSCEWSETGAGACTFGDANDCATTITCDTAGSVTVTCEVSDGELTDDDSLELTVESDCDALEVYPDLCMEEIDDATPTWGDSFSEPIAPASSGAWVEVDTAAELITAAQADGQNVRVTADITTAVTITSSTDTTIEIADGVRVYQLSFVTSARVNVHGAGPTSTLNQWRASTGNTDLSVDSLLMPPEPGGGGQVGRVRVTGSCTRCAVVSVIGKGGNATSGGTDGYGTNPSVALINNGTDLLIANSNFYAPSNSSSNDWVFRLDPTTRVVFADVWMEGRSNQRIIRNQAVADDTLVYRSTLVSLNNCKAEANIGGTGLTDFYYKDTAFYLDNDADSSAGYSPHTDTRITNAEFHTNGSGACSITHSGLDTSEPVNGQWTAGSPTYDTSNARPTPPVICSARGFCLDADAGGSADGDPREL